MAPWGGSFSKHCRMLSRSPGFYAPEAGSTHPAQVLIIKMFPDVAICAWRAKLPLAEPLLQSEQNPHGCGQESEVTVWAQRRGSQKCTCVHVCVRCVYVCVWTCTSSWASAGSAGSAVNHRSLSRQTEPGRSGQEWLRLPRKKNFHAGVGK